MARIEITQIIDRSPVRETWAETRARLLRRGRTAWEIEMDRRRQASDERRLTRRMAEVRTVEVLDAAE